ncbi:MAG: hypothetical protein H6550_13905 [Chitinophagales bacterium]|nr:hypothetical protein [Chitinophagales bacterium]
MEQERRNEILRDRALADNQKFVFPYITTGRLNKQQLSDWMTVFNRWLSLTGRVIEAEREYRRQFAAWFMHIDLTVESPAQYDLENTMSFFEKKVSGSKTIPLPIAYAVGQPKGKFSKGNNKFDMYWLKNLRDEVRSMGI